MKDDYLWDGSGEPDPEIQRLEKVLGRFRHRRPAPDLPARVSAWERFQVWLWSPAFATAVAVLVIAAGTWLLVRRAIPVSTPPTHNAANHGGAAPSPKSAWEVSRLEGSVKIGAMNLGDSGALPPGEWLETNSASRVRISVAKVGQVDVEPDTRLRLVETGANRHLLALARGTISAMIWAPPGEFVVDTPSATAVDLGCAYTLHVDGRGDGLLRVTFGWVGFKLKGRESFIPEGAVCATRPDIGPGMPYYPDSSAPFRAALEKVDFEYERSAARAQDLNVILSAARKRDALTLWHLLARVDVPDRERVYERLAGFVPPPAGVTRAGILKGDARMRDLWWNQLGLGDMDWWRKWERAWPEKAVASGK